MGHIALGRRLDDEGIAGLRDGEAVEHRRRVAHRLRLHEVHGHAVAPFIVEGPEEMRPREGFSPIPPHQAAGPRIEPPISEPWAMGTMPAATAAAPPPVEPQAE